MVWMLRLWEITFELRCYLTKYPILGGKLTQSWFYSFLSINVEYLLKCYTTTLSRCIVSHHRNWHFDDLFNWEKTSYGSLWLSYIQVIMEFDNMEVKQGIVEVKETPIASLQSVWVDEVESISKMWENSRCELIKAVLEEENSKIATGVSILFDLTL